MSVPRIALTGATGHIGGRVARRLAEQSVPTRLLVRDPDRAPDLPDAEVVTAPYDDSEAVQKALADIDLVFFVSASESAERLRDHECFVWSAAAAGVRHVVYLSYYGAMRDSTFTYARTHWHTEQLLREARLQWTFLRDNMYADFLPELVGEDGVIRGPAGKGRVAPVAQDDVADVAAAVLVDRKRHAGCCYELTGPDSLTFAKIAELLTEASGREVRFEDETLDAAYDSREATGAEEWEVDGWVSTYTAAAAGELGTVTKDVQKVTGHRATPVRDVLAGVYGRR